MRNLLHSLLKKDKQWNFQKGNLTESLDKLHNPDRGWYRIYTYSAEENPDFEAVLQDGNRNALALIIVNIGAFREKDISAEALNNIRSVLAFFAQKQYDIVLRITYDHEGKALEREPFFFSRVKDHLQQLTPVIGEFAENIFVFQGMLVGNWGEMHTSRFLDSAKLQDLWGILSAQVEEKVFFAVRKPAQWRLLHPDNCGRKQLIYDRMGLFDDAIMGSESHLGTFGTVSREKAGWEELWAREDELDFENELCIRVPNGGEAVCGEGYPDREDAAGTVDVLRKMHLTYLNRHYDERILHLWQKWKWQEPGVWQGRSLFEYIGAHLGYRFWIKDVNVSLTTRKERMFVVDVTIENRGFANLYEEAELYIEWDYGSQERYLKKLDCDMRQWNSGTVQSVSCKLPPSECELYLFARRKRDGRKIYFANESSRGNKVFLGSIRDVQIR